MAAIASIMASSVCKRKPPSTFPPLPFCRSVLLDLLSTSSSPLEPNHQPDQTDDDDAAATTTTTSGLPTPLTPTDAKLLNRLHALIQDHHRTNPSLSPPSSDFTLPSLSSAFSALCPSPPSPSLAHRLLLRLRSPRHSHPFPQSLSFFNWWLSSLSTLSHPSIVDPFTEVIDFAGKLQHFDIAYHLLDRMREVGLPITLRTYSVLVRRLVRAGRVREAADAFRRMPGYGLAPDANALSVFIAALSKKRAADDAQSLFDSLRGSVHPDVVVYSTLVHSWCRAGRLDEAERVFREMKENGITPNVYTYTAVIDAMCRAGHIPRAHELLCQMIDAGCPPNTATFNSFMRAHVKAARREQVLQVNNQMKQLGCEPDVITYNFLIETHCQKGQQNLDAALKVLNQMAAKGCIPNAHTFNPVFRCILNVGDINAAQRLYERMGELKVQPNTVTYNLLVELFSNAKSMDMVLKMKREMEAEGVEPNVNTYAVLITAFCGRGHWKQAYGLMREMVEEKGLKPTKLVYQMVMELLRNAGQLKKHEELVEKMADRGFITRHSPL